MIAQKTYIVLPTISGPRRKLMEMIYQAVEDYNSPRLIMNSHGYQDMENAKYFMLNLDNYRCLFVPDSSYLQGFERIHIQDMLDYLYAPSVNIAVGDWVTYDNKFTYKVREVFGNDWFRSCRGSSHKSYHRSQLRLATTQEIRAAQENILDFSVNGYKMAVRSVDNTTLITFGCAVFTKHQFELMVEFNHEAHVNNVEYKTNRFIEQILLNSGVTITMNEICEALSRCELWEEAHNED